MSSLVLIIYLGGIIVILIFQRLGDVKELAQLLTSKSDWKPAPFPCKASAQVMVLLGLLPLTREGQLPAGSVVS